MTLYKDIMPYLDKFIHVYGWNLSVLWSPSKIWTPKSFSIANFRHPVSKSWLRPCYVPSVHRWKETKGCGLHVSKFSTKPQIIIRHVRCLKFLKGCHPFFTYMTWKRTQQDSTWLIFHKLLNCQICLKEGISDKPKAGLIWPPYVSEGVVTLSVTEARLLTCHWGSLQRSSSLAPHKEKCSTYL